MNRLKKLVPLIFLSSLLSAQYVLKNDVLDDGGNKMTNAHYTLRGSFGQSTTGKSTNLSYTASIGFWHPYYFVTRDVGVIAILWPVDTIPAGSHIPKARVKNYGDIPETFPVYFRIIAADTVYRDMRNITLSPGQEDTVEFNAWNATEGSYTTYCLTALTGDMFPANDKETGQVWVRISGWVKIGDVPLPPDHRRIGSGGGVARCGERLYILKGNNTRSLYRYIRDAPTAVFEDTVPSGPSRKNVRRGSAMVSDGRYLYIFKGANTREFFRYDTQRGETIWKTLPGVPRGGGRALRGGTGAAYARDFVYLLKGSKTREFYRFNIAADTWERRRDAPDRRGYKDGSCLVAYNDTLLYALQGDHNSFHLYNVKRDSWYPKAPLPIYHPQVNRRRVAKEGAAMTILAGNICVFKGGNTPEFWMYVPERDTWIGKDTIPFAPDGRRVRGGGSLAAVNGDIFALKGNNTTSIWRYWRYTAPPVILASLPNTGVQGDAAERKGVSLAITPNPTRGTVNLYYSLPEKEIATLRIYNLLGEVVYSAKGNKGVFTVQRLPAGVYFLRFEAKGYREDRKLVVVK